MFRTQSSNATQLDHCIAINSFAPSPVARVKWVVLNFEYGFSGIADAQLVQTLHLIFQFINSQIHNLLKCGCCLVKHHDIISFQICPVEVCLSHERQGRTARRSSFLTGRSTRWKNCRSIFAILHNLLHDLRQCIATQIQRIWRECCRYQGNWTEMTEQFKVIVSAKKKRLCFVHFHSWGRKLRQLQQRIHAANTDVASAVNGMCNGIDVRVSKIIKLLPPGLIIIGRISACVGIV